jgi:hypothetical protein
MPESEESRASNAIYASMQGLETPDTIGVAQAEQQETEGVEGHQISSHSGHLDSSVDTSYPTSAHHHHHHRHNDGGSFLGLSGTHDEAQSESVETTNLVETVFPMANFHPSGYSWISHPAHDTHNGMGTQLAHLHQNTPLAVSTDPSTASLSLSLQQHHTHPFTLPNFNSGNGIHQTLLHRHLPMNHHHGESLVPMSLNSMMLEGSEASNHSAASDVLSTHSATSSSSTTQHVNAGVVGSGSSEVMDEWDEPTSTQPFPDEEENFFQNHIRNSRGHHQSHQNHSALQKDEIHQTLQNDENLLLHGVPSHPHHVPHQMTGNNASDEQDEHHFLQNGMEVDGRHVGLRTPSQSQQRITRSLTSSASSPSPSSSRRVPHTPTATPTTPRASVVLPDEGYDPRTRLALRSGPSTPSRKKGMKRGATPRAKRAATEPNSATSPLFGRRSKSPLTAAASPSSASSSSSTVSTPSDAHSSPASASPRSPLQTVRMNMVGEDLDVSIKQAPYIEKRKQRRLLRAAQVAASSQPQKTTQKSSKLQKENTN